MLKATDVSEIYSDTTVAVNLQNAANMMQVSIKTVRREVTRGKLHAVRIGRILRIRVSEIHAYLKRQEGL